MLAPTRLTTVITIAFALASSQAFAKFVMPSDAPVDRLVKNLAAYIEEHPKDAQGYYNLARVHSLAFTLKAKSIGAFERRELPYPADEDMQKFTRKVSKLTEKDDKKAGTNNTDEPTSSELEAHIREAVRNFNKAIAIDPKKGLFFLSLGSLLESAVAQSSECWFAPLNIPVGIDEKDRDAAVRMVQDIVDGKSDASEAERIIAGGKWDWSAHQYRALIAALQDAQFAKDQTQRAEIRRLLDLHWNQATKDCYFQAFKLGFPEESQRKYQPIRGLKDLISHDAAQSFLRVTKNSTAQQKEKGRIAEVTAGLASLQKIPPSHAITPIIFSMSPSQSVRQLVAPRVSVTFDLDGTGLPQQWTWVRPETGILVWDPSGIGQVTSGRQLFGSVTWWMFWENGYRALDALDDNRDGELSGSELVGLAVWFDRNASGASDPGEVVPLARLAITRVACSETTESDGCPANLHGLTLADGTELPTYDWIARSTNLGGRGELSYHVITALAVIASAFLFMHRRSR